MTQKSSGYSKMQAPPFWKWMFRIAGIACLITLMTPTVYLLKYALHDHPMEERVASNTEVTTSALSAPAFPGGTDLYIKSAEGKWSVPLRTLAIYRLGDLAESIRTQIAYPVECLHAKLALEQVANADPNLEVRAAAQTTLMAVAEHGAVVER